MTRHFTQSIGINLLALVLLSACSSNQAQVVSGTKSSGSGTVAESNTSNTSTDTPTEQQQAPGGMMDEGQMKLLSTFRSLTMLDEQDGLGITKAQAEVILPIVKAAVTANELTEDSAASITAELTEDQQAYLTKMAEQMPSGGRPGEQAGSGADGAGAPPEGGGGNPPEGQAPPVGDDGQGERPEGAPVDGEGAPAGGPGGGGNMGQQLIELLQGKINGTES
ncbi:hypothetical protein D3C81_1527090 [compost metagenome]